MQNRHFAEQNPAIMSKKSITHLSMALALAVLLAGAGSLKSLDVSQFLTQESGARLTWGSPGGVAYDGTNFLIAARSTNGGIVAIRVATNGVMPGPQLDLGTTGGLPRVAFDGSNYLLAWPDFGDAPSDIYGQFIRPDGTMVGSRFLIEADADAEEMGGLAFDGTNYLAVWESDTGSSNAAFAVNGRFVTPAGDLLGPRLEISGGTTGQRFPNAAWNGERYLVIWTSQTEGANEWNVRGRQIDRDGVLMDSVIINENPAQQPWPPTLASDGTNWLAAWCRESGPYLVLNSNLWLPMLYGRIVMRDGAVSGHEVQIRWGGLGQFKPKATFNGENYLVGWMEKGRSYEAGSPPYVSWFWQSAVRQLNLSGQPVMTEFWIRRMFNYSPIAPPGMAMGEGAGRLLVVWEAVWDHSNWESTLIRLSPSFSLRNFTGTPGGGVQFDLVGPNNLSYGVEVTSNFVNWGPILEGGINLLYPGRITVPGTGNRSFFRAFDGQIACRENQRLIQQAKDHWALEHNKTLSDTPVDSDLFGPGRYLPSKPICPNGGQYNFGIMVDHPACSFSYAAGHSY